MEIYGWTRRVLFEAGRFFGGRGQTPEGVSRNWIEGTGQAEQKGLIARRHP